MVDRGGLEPPTR